MKLFDVFLIGSLTQNSNNNEPDGCSYLLVGLLLLIPAAIELLFLCLIVGNVADHHLLGDWALICIAVFVVLYCGVHYLALRHKWLRIGLYISFFLFWGLFALPLYPDMYYNLIHSQHWENTLTNKILIASGIAIIMLGFRFLYLENLCRRTGR